MFPFFFILRILCCVCTCVFCFFKRCSTCHEIYRIRIQYHFLLVWERFCTFRSLGHIFEFIIVISMLCIGIFTIILFQQQHSIELAKKFKAKQQYQQLHGIHTANIPTSPYDDENAEGMFVTILIYILFGLTIILVPITLYTVYQRWKKANSTSEVIEMV